MSAPTISRSRARLATRIAQGSALAFAACAVAALALPQGESVVAPPKTSGKGSGDQTSAPTTERPRFRDFDAIGQLLAAYDRPPAPPPVTAPNQGSQGNGTAAAQPQLRFLGAISLPGRKSAILALDNEQRILREGGMIRDYRVEAIADDYVEVSRAGRTQRVPLRAPTGVQISFLGVQPGSGGEMFGASGDQRARAFDPMNANIGEDAIADGMTRAVPGGASTTTMRPSARRATPMDPRLEAELREKAAAAEGLGVDSDDGGTTRIIGGGAAGDADH